jgi:bacterial/archaeal transporter family-2 protein
MNQGIGTVLVLVTLLGAGAGLSVQAPINAVLARAAGGLAMAACISFFLGFLLLAVVTMARGDWPPPETLAQAPWWAWIGGAFGVLYLLSTTWSVPQVGVLTTLAAVILGQLVAAIVLDRIGAFGLPVHEITWPRIAGVAMVAGGLILTRM